jgi:nucleoside-diphosphate-sugar epimerase
VRVFVTGGSGLLGSHTVRALTARGDTVFALSRSHASDEALRALGAEVLRGDIGDDASMMRGVKECDAVVHAAAVVLSRRGWDWFYATNVAPAEAVARLCAREGRRLVHVSSVAVYGRATTYDQGVGSVTEEFGLSRPLFPGDHYARSKREAELALWRVADATDLSAVALRPCVIYGEHDRAFAIRVARVVRRGIAPVIGPGDNPLSAVYAGNVAAAVVAALDRPAVRGAFNVCNDGVITQRAFVEQFARGMGRPLRIVRVPKAVAWNAAGVADALMRLAPRRAPMSMLRPAVQFLANANPFVSAKAERELGWVPVVAPEEAVLRTGAWFASRQ